MTIKGWFSYWQQRIDDAASQAVEVTIARGAALYRREAHLHGLVRVEIGPPGEEEPAKRARILRALATALRAERALGCSGHWTYDLNRHIALQQAYRAELLGAETQTAAQARPLFQQAGD